MPSIVFNRFFFSMIQIAVGGINIADNCDTDVRAIGFAYMATIAARQSI